jgi:hypothetical protein
MYSATLFLVATIGTEKKCFQFVGILNDNRTIVSIYLKGYCGTAAAGIAGTAGTAALLHQQLNKTVLQKNKTSLKLISKENILLLGKKCIKECFL